MSCSLHLAYRGVVNVKIKDGIYEQCVMDVSPDSVIAHIGEQL